MFVDNTDHHHHPLNAKVAHEASDNTDNVWFYLRSVYFKKSTVFESLSCHSRVAVYIEIFDLDDVLRATCAFTWDWFQMNLV